MIDRLQLISDVLVAASTEYHGNQRIDALARVLTSIISSSATDLCDAHCALDHVVRVARATINLRPASAGNGHDQGAPVAPNGAAAMLYNL